MYYLGEFLKNVRLVDFFDISVVSIIIYRFLLIIQGTRAFQALLGIFALSVLWWLSEIYDLYALEWVLEHFFDYLFIILIVLFQDQIRAALVGFAGTKLLGKHSKDDFDQDIEEVVAAAGALSREKTGALIVFEKNQGLLNYSQTGTKIDSKVHSDILYSIFQNSSPLHDGAVIIFRGRIQSAGCFLPLSKNVEIDRHFGTRHRAALGITEVSDAIVVSVSEETGKMNLCYNGTFYQMNDEQELRKTLRRFLLEIDKLSLPADILESRRMR